MAYKLRWTCTPHWVPDGAGPMSVNSAQSIQISSQFGQNGGSVLVPGGDSPTAANFATAAATVGTNIATALQAQPLLGDMQGWATGGG